MYIYSAVLPSIRPLLAAHSVRHQRESRLGAIALLAWRSSGGRVGLPFSLNLESRSAVQFATPGRCSATFGVYSASATSNATSLDIMAGPAPLACIFKTIVRAEMRSLLTLWKMRRCRHL